MARRSVSVFVVVATTVALAQAAQTQAHAAPASTGKGTIVGNVSDAYGRLLANVDVWLEPAALAGKHPNPDLNGPHARTDQHGHFVMQVVPDRYLLVFDGSQGTGGHSDAGGYQLKENPTLSYHVSSGGLAVANVTLAEGAALQGAVTDAGGHPLQGVVITAVPPSPYEGEYATPPAFVQVGPGIDRMRSAADGSFTIKGLVPGVTRVCFAAAGYGVTGGDTDTSGYADHCTSQTVFAHAHESDPVPTVQLTSTTGGELTGRIRDTSGRPIKNVRATIRSGSGYNAKTWSTADGQYAFHGLPAGRYRVCIETTYATAAHRPVGGFAPGCAPWTTVGDDATSTRNVTAQRGGRIAGRVTGSENEPIRGVVVRASGAHESEAVTGEDGRYSIDNLDTGSYQVSWNTAAASGPHNESGVLAIKRRSDNFRHVRTGRTLVLDRSLPVGGAVQGWIDGPHDRIAGITARIAGVGAIPTGRSGQYVIHGVPPGRHSVCFSSDGQDAWGYPVSKWITQCRSEVTVRADRTTRNIDATLTRYGRVSVHVTDTAGNPVAGSNVVLLASCSGDCETYPGFTGNGGKVVTVPSRFTDADGTVVYAQPTGDFAICLRNQYAHAASDDSPTGYADKCVDPAAFSTHVTNGETTTVPVQLASN